MTRRRTEQQQAAAAGPVQASETDGPSTGSAAASGRDPLAVDEKGRPIPLPVWQAVLCPACAGTGYYVFGPAVCPTCGGAKAVRVDVFSLPVLAPFVVAKGQAT